MHRRKDLKNLRKKMILKDKSNGINYQKRTEVTVHFKILIDLPSSSLTMPTRHRKLKARIVSSSKKESLMIMGNGYMSLKLLSLANNSWPK